MVAFLKLMLKSVQEDMNNVILAFQFLFQFFDPIKVIHIDILYKDGHPLGKANAFFKTHEDAKEAMKVVSP